MTTTQPSLSVIIPVRFDEERGDLLDRLEFTRFDSTSSSIEIILVDDGSLPIEAAALREKCEELGYHYVATGAVNRTFSIGRARNLGVQVARTSFVMFQDVDLIPNEGFYQRVLVELEVQQLTKFAERFLMFGVIYLTESGTREFHRCSPEVRQSLFTQYLLEDDANRIEKFSTGTSVIVVSRDYFLSSGGMDSEFEGWGFEDIEFTCRALRRNRRFPFPAQFDRDLRNFRTIQEYRGWKSIYRLFGDMTFAKGIVLFHAWHPVCTDGAYMCADARNKAMFEKKVHAFRQHQVEPAPLPKPERGVSLLFRRNPYVLSRWIAPSWGTVVLVNESDFAPTDLLDFVRERGITRVVFHNPFATPEMEAHYDAVRDAGIDYIVCERGALPGSTFFDPNGFNGQSTSYDSAHWDRPLDMTERRATYDYIRRLVTGEGTLEEQPLKVGHDQTRRSLGIQADRKVLFIPLQRPADTVITKLAHPIGGYQSFLDLVRETREVLDPDWDIVVKRHPLEVDVPDLPGVTWANEHHVHDLLDVCDAVLLINSGVGLLALAHGKPVLVAGTAFYLQPGLAVQATSAADVCRQLATFRPDEERILRFFHYLVFEFYSFGTFKTRTVNWAGGAMMTATTDIEYREIRVPGLPTVRYERPTDVAVREHSILFDRYRQPNGKIRRGASVSSAASKSQAALPTPSATKSQTNGKPTANIARKARKLSKDPRAFLKQSQFAPLRIMGRLI